MPVDKRSVSLPPVYAQAVERRDSQFSTALTKSLGRYFYALADVRRRLADQFSDQECGLILDACNGTLFYPFSINLIGATIQDAISMDRLDQKWEVDGAALAAKLNELNYFERLVVVDAVEVWWERSATRESREDEQPAFGDLFRRHPDNNSVREFQM